VDETQTEEVGSFVYVRSVVSVDGGTEDVASGIKKADGVFVQLYLVWSNHNVLKGVKLRIFNTDVKSGLLYACETWKTTNQITRRLLTFINKCLRRMKNIKWTDKITNEELWRITKQKPIEIQIKRRQWNWIGILRNIEEEVGRRKRGEGQ
jgi:hypothetical protein